MLGDSKLLPSSKGSTPVIKKKTIAKLIQIIKNLDLCDIWRICNSKRRLGYFFISYSFQESIKTTHTLAAFFTDHSPVTLSLCSLKYFQRGRGLWKFNKSLIKNENCLEQMKTLIKNVLGNLDQNNIEDPEFRWEYLKYEIRKIFHLFFKRYCTKYENCKNVLISPEYTETNEKLDKIYQ